MYFLPYLTGERCPHNDVYARGAFVGLSAETTREDMCLAVYEGVAYALRDCIEAGGVSVESAVLCGGGAKSPLWQNVVSNVLGVEIYVTETEQFGAAMLAMVGCGEYPDLISCAEATVRKRLAAVPDKDIHEKYNKGFETYRKLYPLLREV